MRHLTPLMCSFALATLAGSADADTAETVQAHVDEGTKLYNVQRYDKAADEYQAAYLLDPKPEYLYAIAQSQRLAGDCAKALHTYRAYLRTDPSADQRAKAEKNIERCTVEVQQLEAKLQASRPDVQVVASDGEMPSALGPTPQPEQTAPVAPKKSFVIGHVLVGAGVAAIAGGAYFYRKGHRTIEDHNAAPTYDEFVATSAGLDGARREQIVGVSALAAGSGLVISGVLFYIWRDRAPVDTRVSTQVQPGSAMVTFGGAF